MAEKVTAPSATKIIKVVKVVNTKTGKVRYQSEIDRDKRKAQARRSEGIVDWADWKPKHKLGVFSNISTNPHTHNKERKYL